MKTDKKRESISVVENKKETCGCGCDSCHCGGECHCGDNCHCGEGCHCGGRAEHTLFNAGITLISALMIAGAIVYTGTQGPRKRPIMPRVPEATRSVKDADIANFIKNNPKVIIDALESHYKEQQAKEQKAAPQQPKGPAAADIKSLAEKIIADKGNYSIGNPKGEFVIIEFFDYNCGWCKRTNKEMWEAVNSAEGKNIRWILIDTPIFGAGSELISRYVLAAGKQGKFTEMHHAVSQAKGKTEDDLIKMAEGLKLDIKKLKADANSDELKNKIKANQEYSRTLKVGGVPMLIVNGNLHQGALLGDQLKAVVAESNKKAAK